VLRIRIPHHIAKQALDPHQIEKLDSDPDPQQSQNQQNQDPDPYKSKNSGTGIHNHEKNLIIF
jgi:hypothetical protein